MKVSGDLVDVDSYGIEFFVNTDQLVYGSVQGGIPIVAGKLFPGQDLSCQLSYRLAVAVLKDLVESRISL